MSARTRFQDAARSSVGSTRSAASEREQGQGQVVQCVEALVVALLSVNRFQLEKAWALLPGLRDGGLTTSSGGSLSVEEVVRRLVRAGYDRGGLNALMALRLKAFLEAVGRGEVVRVVEALPSGDEERVHAAMLRLPGVGPTVARAAWLLLST